MHPVLSGEPLWLSAASLLSLQQTWEVGDAERVAELRAARDLSGKMRVQTQAVLLCRWDHVTLAVLDCTCEYLELAKKHLRLQVEESEPSVMWLSGLHIPESYLTALVQATCRKNGWPLDRSTLYTQVTKYRTVDEVTERPGQGRTLVKALGGFHRVQDVGLLQLEPADSGRMASMHYSHSLKQPMRLSFPILTPCPAP